MKNLLGLIVNFTAAAAVLPRQLVKFSAAQGQIEAAGAGDIAIGVTTDVGAAAGERCDVALTGIAPVTYGAAVTQGQRLKSDANGATIPADAADIAIGIAMVSSAAGEIGSVLLRS